MHVILPESVEHRIHPTAIVHPSAKIGIHNNVGAYSIINVDVTISEGVYLGHHVVLGRKTRIGNSVRVSSNTIIGTSGFGLVTDHTTQGRQIRLPHVGGVRIDIQVKFGSCGEIARITIDDSIIGPQVKINDHVFIAHNASIGENEAILAGTGISGSVMVGTDCWIAS